jgi:four helix bundle protein
MNHRPPSSPLPHHNLLAYRVAVELLIAVRDARLEDAVLREQALRAAKSACLNTAEGAGRGSRADRARVFAIARGEVVEACAAVEIAGVLGAASAEAVRSCVALGSRLGSRTTAWSGTSLGVLS